MRTFSKLSVVALTALLPAGALAHSSSKDKVALGKEASVEIAQAQSRAIAKVPGKVVETELSRKKGKPVWEVEIVTAEGKLMEVDVDAQNGDVLDSEARR